ncbi:ATP-binding protein [Streptomyces tagetis]|uniref:ATP-binding protein n=1 Tax=Streptomyces tagetis TaxID=2820809 RepID=A0A940XET0_9ACTN|nr:ATP-binding protein [Streptomyces sp. RG38]MBQ0825842.1 ATP-binding protein [Streptomyces sp. RG38]
MPHTRVGFTVEATAAAVHRARHRVSAAVRAWGGPPDDDLVFRLELVASELLTNGLRHADGGPMTVELTPEEDHVVVGVFDGCPVLPGPSVMETDDDRGRGLALVEALCLFQGAERTALGKRCWAVLPRATAPTPAGRSPHAGRSRAAPEDAARWSVTPAGRRLLATLFPATSPAEPR